MRTIHEYEKTAATVGPTESEIAAVAYQLWVDNEYPVGSDQEDWFRAEAMLGNARAAKGKDLVKRQSAPACDLATESEMLAELASEGLQGHWEVWEREWVGARWVCDAPASGVRFPNYSR